MCPTIKCLTTKVANIKAGDIRPIQIAKKSKIVITKVNENTKKKSFFDFSKFVTRFMCVSDNEIFFFYDIFLFPVWLA